MLLQVFVKMPFIYSPFHILSSSSCTEGGQICQFIKCLGLVFFHINVNKFITGSMCTITVVC